MVTLIIAKSRLAGLILATVSVIGAELYKVTLLTLLLGAPMIRIVPMQRESVTMVVNALEMLNCLEFESTACPVCVNAST